MRMLRGLTIILGGIVLVGAVIYLSARFFLGVDLLAGWFAW